MIQCVGPGERFCSRICCTVALKNALAFKARFPDSQVTVLYRDIRTYGFKERLYTQARAQGVIFVRYDDEHRPELVTSRQSPLASQQETITSQQSSIVDRHSSSVIRPSSIVVHAWDSTLGRPLELPADLVVLSMPVVPDPGARTLAARFKVPLDADGFFLEAHVKLRPVDFATDGVFMAGLAHYPKLLEESLIQAQAAAARAARVLSRESLVAGGRVAVVDASRCTGCLTCVRICPFNVPRIRADLTGAGGILGAAFIEPAVCQGCGSCAAECPARAIQLMHYTDAQLFAKVGALLERQPVDLIALERIEVMD